LQGQHVRTDRGNRRRNSVDAGLVFFLVWGGELRADVGRIVGRIVVKEPFVISRRDHDRFSVGNEAQQKQNHHGKTSVHGTDSYVCWPGRRGLPNQRELSSMWMRQCWVVGDQLSRGGDH
jgi:hypothetical protein